MRKYYVSGQMDLSDRIAIETGICSKESFKKIAKHTGRHPSTIAHEVKENRTFIKGNYPNGKDCKWARTCAVRNLCGCDEKIVIQDVEYVEASIVQKHAKDMSQLPAISLIHHHMFVITAHIKNSVIRINIFTVQSLQKQL